MDNWRLLSQYTYDDGNEAWARTFMLLPQRVIGTYSLIAGEKTEEIHDAFFVSNETIQTDKGVVTRRRVGKLNIARVSDIEPEKVNVPEFTKHSFGLEGSLKQLDLDIGTSVVSLINEDSEKIYAIFDYDERGDLRLADIPTSLFSKSTSFDESPRIPTPRDCLELIIGAIGVGSLDSTPKKPVPSAEIDCARLKLYVDEQLSSFGAYASLKVKEQEPVFARVFAEALFEFSRLYCQERSSFDEVAHYSLVSALRGLRFDYLESLRAHENTFIRLNMDSSEVSIVDDEQKPVLNLGFQNLAMFGFDGIVYRVSKSENAFLEVLGMKNKTYFSVPSRIEAGRFTVESPGAWVHELLNMYNRIQLSESHSHP